MRSCRSDVMAWARSAKASTAASSASASPSSSPASANSADTASVAVRRSSLRSASVSPGPCLGELEDVLGLVTDALDLLEEQGEAQHRSDVGGALHGDVDDELGPELLLGLVDPAIGGPDVVGHLGRVGVGQQGERGEIERVAGVAEHRDRPWRRCGRSHPRRASSEEFENHGSCLSAQDCHADERQDDEDERDVRDGDAPPFDRRCRPVSPPPGPARRGRTGARRGCTIPAMLNVVCASATVSASGLDAASDASSAVMVVPTLAPSVTG